MNKITQKLVVESTDLEDYYIDYFTETIHYKPSLEISATGQITIPVTVFSSGISPSRALIKYLAETKKFSLKQISLMLNKNYSNVWLSHKKTLENKQYLSWRNSKYSEYSVPLSVFVENKSFTVFESLVSYLKKFHNFSNIAKILNKDPRTIWTVYSRVKKKLARNMEV